MLYRFVAILALATAAHAADVPVMNVPSVDKRMRLAREAIATKDWQRALQELQRAAEQDVQNADVHNLLGYTYRKQDKPDLAKAFEHYKTALRLDPAHKGAHEYIGEAYLMAKQPAEAEKHLQDLARLCGNTQCEEYQDLAQALTAYKKAQP